MPAYLYESLYLDLLFKVTESANFFFFKEPAKSVKSGKSGKDGQDNQEHEVNITKLCSFFPGKFVMTSEECFKFF